MAAPMSSSVYLLCGVFMTIAVGQSFPQERGPDTCNPFLRLKCFKMCPQVYQPVCGCDGITYINECTFTIAQCLSEGSNIPLKIVSAGECQKQCKMACIEIYDPVCGSDGKTYINQCKLNRANCLQQLESNGKPIKLVHKGECGPLKCNQICTKEYKPVCGSDGTTYGNDCTFESAKCLQDGLGNKLTKLYDGPCLEDKRDCDAIMCLAVYDPVCGSDGKTYSNTCVLGVADCKSKEAKGPAITVAKKGEC